jgi:uncharacterized protein
LKFIIAGGTGFIGQKLMDILISEGHEIVILSRKPKQNGEKIKYVKWLEESAAPENEIGSADGFINLAGVSINDGRWTLEHQKQIYDSRMTATGELIRIIEALPEKPSVLINASAIGIYPASLDTVYTEASVEIANDFLARTVHDWEMKAASMETHGIRTVFMRFGVVLGREGGALPLMALPYKMFVGGTMGSGKQWVSWVHVTSPSPMKMKDFGKTIGSVLNRPHWFPVPSFAMKWVLGQKSALVLEGQHVKPQVLMINGFDFSFPTLEPALKDLLK